MFKSKMIDAPSTNFSRVFQSEDYSKFKLSNNRPVSESNVKKKIKSITKTGLQQPITVVFCEDSVNLNIVDGQHRFSALKELGLPIEYMISYNHNGVDDTIEINDNTVKWGTEDLLGVRVEEGSISCLPEAIEWANNLHIKFGIKIVSALELACDGNARTDSAKKRITDKTYNVDFETANEVLELAKLMQINANVIDPRTVFSAKNLLALRDFYLDRDKDLCLKKWIKIWKGRQFNPPSYRKPQREYFHYLYITNY